MIVGMESKDDG
jgi:hypothetical protein